jgi:hypothetical protein
MTQNEIIEMAHQATGMFAELPMMDACIFDDKSLEAFAKLVDDRATARERERLAKVFDARNTGTGFYEPHEPAQIIRGEA